MQLSFWVTILETQCQTNSLGYNFSLLNGYDLYSTDYGYEETITINNITYNSRLFRVDFKMSESNYCQTVNFTFGTTATSSTNCVAPATFTNYVSATFDYCHIPAVMSIGATPGTANSFYIYTECTCGCGRCNTLCPSGGTLTYHLVGSSTWTTITFPGYGGPITGVPSGNYEFYSTLDYTNCSSAPTTGTFTVN